MRAIAFVLATAGVARAQPVAVEWTAWLGVESTIRTGDRELGVRAGAAVDFELVQVPNPWKTGGNFELRAGPWLGADTTFDSHVVEGGVALDVGQTTLATNGTYTVRLGLGLDDDHRRLGSLTVLGGVRYVPARDFYPKPKTAHASGARVFATVRKGFDGGTQWLIGIELDPSWVLPPYSLDKLAGGRLDL